MKLPRTIVFLFISLFTTINFAYSDINHYSNILVGDRAATMGGAYIGVSNDSSGTYYNPSGIAFYEGGGLSGSANVYHLQHSTYEKAIRNHDWVRNSGELIPNFFGIIRTWEKHSLGATIAVPDSFTQNQDQILNDLPALGSGDAIKRFAFNLHTADSTYLIGPSYSYKINDKMALGITLSYHYRKNRTINYQTVWYTDSDYEMDNNVAELSENGLEPKLGFLFKITDKLNAGLVINHTFLISSNYTNQITTKARTSNDTTFSEQKSTGKRNTTTHVGVGFAYYPTSSLLFTMDLDMFTAPQADIFCPNGYKGVFNAAIGSEYKLNEKNAVRLGLFTNMSNMPEPSKDTLFVSHVDMYGISTGYTLTYDPSSFTMGVVYSAGNGKSQIYSGTDEVVNTYNQSLTGILSLSYNFK